MKIWKHEIRKKNYLPKILSFLIFWSNIIKILFIYFFTTEVILDSKNVAEILVHHIYERWLRKMIRKPFTKKYIMYCEFIGIIILLKSIFVLPSTSFMFSLEIYFKLPWLFYAIDLLQLLYFIFSYTLVWYT